MKIWCFVALCVLLLKKSGAFPELELLTHYQGTFCLHLLKYKVSLILSFHFTLCDGDTGSYRMAGYTNGCCTDQACFVESSRCYCDEECHIRNDCCDDILAIGCNGELHLYYKFVYIIYCGIVHVYRYFYMCCSKIVSWLLPGNFL